MVVLSSGLYRARKFIVLLVLCGVFLVMPVQSVAGATWRYENLLIPSCYGSQCNGLQQYVMSLIAKDGLTIDEGMVYYFFPKNFLDAHNGGTLSWVNGGFTPMTSVPVNSEWMPIWNESWSPRGGPIVGMYVYSDGNETVHMSRVREVAPEVQYFTMTSLIPAKLDDAVSISVGGRVCLSAGGEGGWWRAYVQRVGSATKTLVYSTDFNRVWAGMRDWSGTIPSSAFDEPGLYMFYGVGKCYDGADMWAFPIYFQWDNVVVDTPLMMVSMPSVGMVSATVTGYVSVQYQSQVSISVMGLSGALVSSTGTNTWRVEWKANEKGKYMWRIDAMGQGSGVATATGIIDVLEQSVYNSQRFGSFTDGIVATFGLQDTSFPVLIDSVRQVKSAMLSISQEVERVANQYWKGSVPSSVGVIVRYALGWIPAGLKPGAVILMGWQVSVWVLDAVGRLRSGVKWW